MTAGEDIKTGLPLNTPREQALPDALPPKVPWWKEHQVLVGCGITLIFQVVVMVVAYFLAIDGRLDDVEDRVTYIEYRIETIEESVSRIEQSVKSLDDKVDRILLGLARDGVDLGASTRAEGGPEEAD